MGGPRGGVLFRAAARARDGEACAGLKAHFHALFEARREPWPRAPAARARASRTRTAPRHPAEALALEGRSYDPEAMEETVALERDRERRGKLKHLKRSEALGEVSSDDEGGYKPGPITMAHGDDEDDVLPPPPMYESDDDGGRLRMLSAPPGPASAPAGAGACPWRTCWRAASWTSATRAASPFPAPRKTRGRRPTGAFASGATPGTRLRPFIRGSSGDTKSTYGVSQYRLRESEGATQPRESGRAMRGASADAWAGVLAQAAYNLMQFLSRGVFTDGRCVAPLRALCADNGLRRGSAARCFYQTLVLAGGGYLDAAQDLSEPYGEILIRPGARWMAEGEKSAEEGGRRKRGADDGDGDDAARRRRTTTNRRSRERKPNRARARAVPASGPTARRG